MTPQDIFSNVKKWRKTFMSDKSMSTNRSNVNPAHFLFNT